MQALPEARAALKPPPATKDGWRQRRRLGQRAVRAASGRAGSQATACWGQGSGILGRCPGAAPCEETKGSRPVATSLTTGIAGATAALFPSGASLGIPKSQPRMPDKGHWEPAQAQDKPCRGSGRYGLPTRVGAGERARVLSQETRSAHPGLPAAASEAWAGGRRAVALRDGFGQLPCQAPKDTIGSGVHPLVLSLPPEWELVPQGSRGTSRGS